MVSMIISTHLLTHRIMPLEGLILSLVGIYSFYWKILLNMKMMNELSQSKAFRYLSFRSCLDNSLSIKSYSRTIMCTPTSSKSVYLLTARHDTSLSNLPHLPPPDGRPGGVQSGQHVLQQDGPPERASLSQCLGPGASQHPSGSQCQSR